MCVLHVKYVQDKIWTFCLSLQPTHLCQSLTSPNFYPLFYNQEKRHRVELWEVPGDTRWRAFEAIFQQIPNQQDRRWHQSSRLAFGSFSGSFSFLATADMELIPNKEDSRRHTCSSPTSWTKEKSFKKESKCYWTLDQSMMWISSRLCCFEIHGWFCSMKSLTLIIYFV